MYHKIHPFQLYKSVISSGSFTSGAAITVNQFGDIFFPPVRSLLSSHG